MKLETIANEIGKVGVFMAIITFIAMSINLVVNTVMDENGNLLSIEVVNKFVNFIIIAITVVVVAVPEGLPLAVTISLAYSVMKMKLENNLVRKLEASETMGGANEICTDKTGTLTQNKMTVKQFYTAEQIYSGRPRDYKTIPSSDLFSKGVLYNCSARVEIDPQTKKLVTKGNCTEQGLINFLIEIGVDVVELLRSKEDRILGVIPFNSARKRASTVVDDP
jgi:Ca2+ transporting ATPase